MLDLGSHVKNILPNNSWEAIGQQKLVYSPIQFAWLHRSKIFSIERLEDIEVYLVVVNTYVDFKAYDIMGEKDPYPTLLGIEWCFITTSLLILIERQ
jgi:hypothetical protein